MRRFPAQFSADPRARLHGKGRMLRVESCLQDVLLARDDTCRTAVRAILRRPESRSLIQVVSIEDNPSSQQWLTQQPSYRRILSPTASF